MNNRKFSGRNLHHRDDHPSSIQQISHDLTLDSHRTRLLERLLLSRSRSQRHFGVDRESSILLSGLSTAVSASEVATTTSAEPEFSVKSSQISRPKLTQSQHHQPQRSLRTSSSCLSQNCPLIINSKYYNGHNVCDARTSFWKVESGDRG